MMENEFAWSVEFGLRLSKRIRSSSDGSSPTKPPKQERKMDRSKSTSSAENAATAPGEYLPSAPMVYAMVTNPSIVDNPDIPSYQPYVHGRCNPPALIPLHMYGIEVEADCYLDTAFVSVTGTWRLHCIAGNMTCDCLVAIPMGEQGSVLGLEIEVTGKSYETQLIVVEDADELGGLPKADIGGYLKPHIFTLKIPKVDSGSKLSVKARWTQKLLYHHSQFCFKIPFRFPAYVTPTEKFSKKEKISIKVNSLTDKQIICKYSSYHMKEMGRRVGKLTFLYEAEVYTWSRSDFEFSYAVSSSDIYGGLLLQSSGLHDFDQREMFSLYLFPGNVENMKVFRKRVVFLVDISGSMHGAPIANVSKAIMVSLHKLRPEDSFNIVAFNAETFLFSSKLEVATQEAVESATEWMSSKISTEGNTKIFLPLRQAMEMLSQKGDAMSLIILITDGAVDNERDICNFVKDRVADGSVSSPSISTFGIGSYCNHYFLQMLAQIGRGYYNAAYQADSISPRFESLFTSSSSVILSKIKFKGLEHLNSPMIYSSSTIQDLSLGSPLILYGRYKGEFPDSIKIQGTLADMSSFTMDLKPRKVYNEPIDKVSARTLIDVLTAQAWLLESRQLKDQVASLSLQTGIPSEFTRVVMFHTCGAKKLANAILIEKPKYTKAELEKLVATNAASLLAHLGTGFGDLKKTAENAPPGLKVKTPDATEYLVKAASGCFRAALDRFCCMCFIKTCSKMNDQCAIIASQICVLLSCCECLDCCYDLCVSCG